MAFNKVILVGNIAQDLELKQTTSGIPVTTFTLAVNRSYGEQTDFINVVAWRKTAEFICNYFTKGKPILVCGSLQSRQWVDKQGDKRNVLEVVADEVSFVGKKDENNSSNTGEFVEIDDGDLPF